MPYLLTHQGQSLSGRPTTYLVKVDVHVPGEAERWKGPRDMTVPKTYGLTLSIEGVLHADLVPGAAVSVRRGDVGGSYVVVVVAVPGVVLPSIQIAG